ncbi:MAG TPA: hypothetical protein VL727_23100 [Puia sp.]|nr:hypothetical protein [Puia sp.]
MSTPAPTARDANLAKIFQVDSSVRDNQKIVENHKKAADHYHLAAKRHLEAARHYQAGLHEKAAEDTVAAQGHSVLAHEYQNEIAKTAALNGKV